MSWVSYTKLKSLCDGLRNKMVSNEYLLANSDKSKGVHMNIGGQDGLMIMSPVTEDGSTPAALWVTDSDANNATELTGGTLSYVTDNGKSSEDFTSLSLVGGVVNVSGKSGAQRRITNVGTPTGDNDAANKKYVDDNNNNNNICGTVTKHVNKSISTESSQVDDFTQSFDKYGEGFLVIQATATVPAQSIVTVTVSARYQIGTTSAVSTGYIDIVNCLSTSQELHGNCVVRIKGNTMTQATITAKTSSGTGKINTLYYSYMLQKN